MHHTEEPEASAEVSEELDAVQQHKHQLLLQFLFHYGTRIYLSISNE
jgi:hypothetical protein